MPYRAPVADYRFVLEHVAGFPQVAATERFAEATPDVVAAMLTEAGRICEEVLAPLQRSGDTEPTRLENGVVRLSPGFAEAYRAVGEGGFLGVSGPVEHGGLGLPISIATALNEMMSGACLASHLSPLMAQGQIEALDHHAPEWIKELYIPRLASGEWTATMNLTEPQAGSDVGALTTRAEPADDGTYRITGQKIYISGGDNDFAENVSHLVLARLPDAPPGTKGISLFLVPKRLPREDGTPGAQNALRVVGLEHKLGLHASATCVMSYEGATGWLIGEPNKGMRCMFTMMNNARLGVGMQGIGVAEGAYQHALAFALERRQGRTPVEGGSGAIVEHADVRRMLATMKADLFAARAIAVACAVAIDMETATEDPAWAARAALLTPIAKAFGTDTGLKLADTGIQIHGGMGVIEETGAAQYWRDVRVTTIYEGTNGIQAMDLVGRKMADGGDAAQALIDEVEAEAEAARARLPDLAGPLWQAAETLREATEAIVATTDPTERFAGSVPYLRGFARVLGAHYHLRAALAEGGAGPRTALAQVYVRRLLPEHAGLLAEARAGGADLYALSDEDLAA
ncbi:acyl-CoA dehydrogenase [Rhodosalinus halophilus]|uniref:3-methylmercaptopropionyl-CoA dehydrogenase n=1 Tax=Rhodosalinus halophilus TaxID=2259333 RepID=A0A365U9K5_9RHOB|nr:acyl-CoA dehydrogenase [Rhodosalinus halophilus]RBI85723.1 acyl-CoA dehydrogenase [Rhodosalinus halophilus]